MSEFIFKEINGDLFSVDSSFSLAHCVSRDLHMNKGIAKIFKRKFGKVDELKSQDKGIGQIAWIKEKEGANERYIFCLITKEKYYYKPTYDILHKSLENLRDFCLENKVEKLAMPKIGCGLDKLNWLIVSEIIKEVFSEIPIELQVCFL